MGAAIGTERAHVRRSLSALRTRWATVVAAGLPPLLYLTFVARYADPTIYADQWNAIPGLSRFVHGDRDLAWLWSQYGEPRIPLVRAYLLVFARFDHLDNRHAAIVSACIQIASYVLLLVLADRYLPKGLHPLGALAIGAVWFSAMNWENSLWAFDVGWFVVGFGLLAVVASLALPRRRRWAWTGLAMAAATLASLAWIHGLLTWVIGAVCILWMRPADRARRTELTVWIAGFATTVAVYLIGYDTRNSSCMPPFCRVWNPRDHPIAGLRFFTALFGNVFPTSFAPWSAPVRQIATYEAIGAALILAAVGVIVHSWRHRADTERFPLPLLLVGFALLAGAGITKGRTGGGTSAAVYGNRYVAIALLLATGLLLEALRSVSSRADGAHRSATRRIAIGALAAVVLIQVGTSVRFGTEGARWYAAIHEDIARRTVNLDEIPPAARTCYLALGWVSGDLAAIARRNEWSQFAPGAIEHYRRLGPPPLPPGCPPTP